MMNINFNVTGHERKKMVQAVSEIIGLSARYQGAPTFAYNVGSYGIDKDGILNGPNNPVLVADLCSLYDFEPVSAEYETQMQGAETLPDELLTIEIPLEGFTDGAIQNLEKLIASKASLIKKAISAENLLLRGLKLQ